MGMVVTPDVMVLLLLLEAAVCMPIFLAASLLLLALVDFISPRLGRLLRYLAFPGVVLHEICHDLMCRAAGIPVRGHGIVVNRGVEGFVKVDVEEIHSFAGALLAGLAPLFLLSLALYLLIAFWPVLPIHFPLKLYLAYSFFVGLPPSAADLQLPLQVARRMPSQALVEFGLLATPLAAAACYLWLCSVMSYPFSIWLLVASLAGGAAASYLVWGWVKPAPYRNP